MLQAWTDVSCDNRYVAMGIVLYYKAVDSEPACPDWAIFERSWQKILTELEWTNKVLYLRRLYVIAWLFNHKQKWKRKPHTANQNKKFHKVALLLFISSLTLPENNITTWKSISHYSMYFYFHLVYNHAKSMPTLFTVSTIPNYVNTVCYIGNLMLHVPSVDKSISN